MLWLKKIADNREQTSLASSLRRKRFGLFIRLLERLEKPVRILDVGGTQRFWEVMAFTAGDGVKITLLNLTLEPVTNPNFTCVIGDARSMSQFADQYFDVVFSNSVIEHVGEYEDQRRMAEEIKRVGKRYFVQTPNRYFPLEPHFLFPFFQFMPIELRAWLVNHYNVGWYRRIEDYATAIATVRAIRLLKKTEFIRLFPMAKLYKEKFLGLTKSFIAYEGW